MPFARPHTNVGVSDNVYQLLMMVARAQGETISDFADQIILAGLQALEADEPRLQRISGLREGIETCSSVLEAFQNGKDPENTSSAKFSELVPPRIRRTRSRSTNPERAAPDSGPADQAIHDAAKEIMRQTIDYMAEEEPEELVAMGKRFLRQGQLAGVDLKTWAAMEGMHEDPEYRERMTQLILAEQEADAEIAKVKARRARTDDKANRFPSTRDRPSFEDGILLGAALVAGGTLLPGLTETLATMKPWTQLGATGRP